MTELLRVSVVQRPETESNRRRRAIFKDLTVFRSFFCVQKNIGDEAKSYLTCLLCSPYGACIVVVTTCISSGNAQRECAVTSKVKVSLRWIQQLAKRTSAFDESKYPDRMKVPAHTSASCESFTVFHVVEEQVTYFQ